jgi:uncharacterized protein
MCRARHIAKPRSFAKASSMPMPEQPDLARLSLAEIAEAAEAQTLPPVASWHPERTGDSAMRIAADGTWFHEGSPITRPNMVRLFSTILRREADGSHVLVTPAEKLSIEVEDAPFIAVELKSDGEGEARQLAFRLNTGDLVMAGPDHPLRFVARDETTATYLAVRGGMDARMARAPWYELAEIALEEGHDPPGVWSGGAFFAIPG